MIAQAIFPICPHRGEDPLHRRRVSSAGRARGTPRSRARARPRRRSRARSCRGRSRRAGRERPPGAARDPQGPRVGARQLRHDDPDTTEHEIDAEVERELETGEFRALDPTTDASAMERASRIGQIGKIACAIASGWYLGFCRNQTRHLQEVSRPYDDYHVLRPSDWAARGLVPAGPCSPTCASPSRPAQPTPQYVRGQPSRPRSLPSAVALPPAGTAALAGGSSSINSTDQWRVFRIMHSNLHYELYREMAADRIRRAPRRNPRAAPHPPPLRGRVGVRRGSAGPPARLRVGPARGRLRQQRPVPFSPGGGPLLLSRRGDRPAGAARAVHHARRLRDPRARRRAAGNSANQSLAEARCRPARARSALPPRLGGDLPLHRRRGPDDPRRRGGRASARATAS